MKNIITQNAKIKKTSKKFNTRVFNFGIPAYKSASGKLTCPMADTCVKFCYAKKGAYIWSNVASVFEERYQLTKTEGFIDAIQKELDRKKPKYMRVHDSGDYYSAAYLEKWLTIARNNPHIRFYSYTNMIALIKKTNLPENYDIIFSDSGKQKDLIDEKHDRHTKIFTSLDNLNTAGYVDSSAYDLAATKWFSKNKKIGLIFH